MATADPTTARDALDTYRADAAYLGGYLGADHARNERRTWIVAAICAVMLVAQVAGGLAFHSIALLAAGVHMGAHVAALLVASLAYGLARRRAGDARFAFGTGKLGDLAGFANAVVLGITAVLIAAESVQRLAAPEAVDYGSALPLAAVGLVVTLVCVALLRPRNGGGGGHDLNIAAAHLHLSADAMVGALAIAGLFAGQKLGWRWADPLAGLAGAALVAQFALSLIRRASATLLDMNPSPELTAEIRGRLEGEGERVLDLHLWRLGPGHNAAIAVIASATPQTPDTYRARLKGLEGLSHVTVEVRANDGKAA
jgi:cation diffusion facilitator family transporter